jgi:predicted AlkP superfamily phosphohydrolase/phosphomutase
VARDLGEIVNLETGQPVVDRVLRCDDLYPGPERAHLPDLFVEWRHGTQVHAVGSGKLPRLEGRYEYVRSGEHRPRGMFVVRGPGIRPGRLADAVACMDWAPTICALLGVQPDDGLDGRVMGPLIEAVGAVGTA